LQKQKNLDISQQKGRQFNVADFENSIILFLMDRSNYDDVIALIQPKNKNKKSKIMRDGIFPNENVDVPDPYYGMSNGFEMVYNMLDSR
jgi:protein-tyrosine phosphatase